MKAVTLLVIVTGMMEAAQSGSTTDPSADSRDTRIERAKGYHIVKHPDRTGATPEDVKLEKAEEDNARRRRNTNISDQAPPTREPELKPRLITP